MIREAIVEDLEVLSPSGTTGIALGLARHLPAVFDFAVVLKFKR
jgi:hypothetical protein